MEKNKSPIVLIIDDEKMTRVLLAKIVEGMGYEPWLCSGTKEAIEQLNRQLPDLIVSDIAMPDMDGYAFCKLIKSEPKTKDIPLIFVSAYITDKDKIKGLKLGAVDYITKPYIKEEVEIRIQTHVKLRLMQEQLEETNYRLNVMVKKQIQMTETVKKTALVALAKVAEGDFLTGKNHLANISYNSKTLAQALAFTRKFENHISDYFVKLIETASMVHDIGVIAIPKNILDKEQLSDDELLRIQEHPIYGKQIFDELFSDMEEDEFMKMSRNVVMYHHERFDGTGYPYGLKGENIPLEARIVAIVDAYDNLCYRYEENKDYIKEVMNREYAGYFDPDILNVLWMVEKQLKKGA